MIQPLFLGSLGLPEILIIAVIILLLFGAKKIPELMRGMGQGVRSFKDGMKEVTDDIEDDKKKDKEKSKDTDKSKEADKE